MEPPANPARFIISALDYSKGLGHTGLVTLRGESVIQSGAL
jgi:hypothetical protein